MKSKGKFIFILGGARSGKSSVAEKITKALGKKVLYIATAAVLDGEMAKRVDLHQKRRPGSWTTIEETHQVSRIIAQHSTEYEVIMIDCLTLLISNLLLDDNYPANNMPMHSTDKEKAILGEIEQLSIAAREADAHIVLVSNDVGAGIVPDNKMGRIYRDIVGWTNQIAARHADEVYYTLAGLPVELKELAKKAVDRYNLSEGD